MHIMKTRQMRDKQPWKCFCKCGIPGFWQRCHSRVSTGSVSGPAEKDSLSEPCARCLQALRSKKGGPLRDKLPPEVFLRLRGSLFFGNSFKVTRNKLSFRENLEELLAGASHGARLPAPLQHLCL